MCSCVVRRLCAAVLAMCAWLVPQWSHAAPWIFQPSQFSQAPPLVQPTGPVDPRLYAGPMYTSPQGAYLRGAYRLSRTQINVRGRTVDQTWHWESWIQGGQQY